MEVKSGPAGKLRSLQQFLAEHPQSIGGLVFHSGNVQDAPAQKMKFLPLYTRLSESDDEDRLSASETDLSAGRVHRGTADQLLDELKKEPQP